MALIHNLHVNELSVSPLITAYFFNDRNNYLLNTEPTLPLFYFFKQNFSQKSIIIRKDSEVYAENIPIPNLCPGQFTILIQGLETHSVLHFKAVKHLYLLNYGRLDFIISHRFESPRSLLL